MRMPRIFARFSKAMNPVPIMRGGWRRILEAFPGAWQKNAEETHGDLLNYPTMYACVMRIATDGGKLPFELKQESVAGIWKVVKNPAYSPVLRKPNTYQTAQQFRESWLLSKLIQGNTYVLKQRDARGVVVALYVLDPCRVQPMVTESGAVFYQLWTDPLNLLPEGYPAENLLVPAREIIHDRCITPHHPLIGVPPICAAYWPALKNLKILKSSAQFFGNNSQPGGILTAPAGMGDKDAEEVKKYWAEKFSGENAGKVAVIGADMKFTSFAMKGADSQLVEQMQYSDRQICQPFGIPPFKIGIGDIPDGMDVDSLNQLYYNDALQTHVEAMENLLDEGLGLDSTLCVELDLYPLLRMDQEKLAKVEGELVKGTIKTPNEARSRFNLEPQVGGDSLYLQQQNYSLAALAKRDAKADPFSKESSTPPADPAQPPEAKSLAFMTKLMGEVDDVFAESFDMAELMAATPMARVRAMIATAP
jgi:HK97 family phage portal protein